MQERYDRLWSGTIERIRKGDLELDPVLSAGRPDRRRGLTVIARPDGQVRRRVAAFVDQLRTLEPEQHYYARRELHVTVLSLFTATIDCGRFFAKTESFVAAVDAALRKAAPFRIEFTGVTASPGAILIQGFAHGEALDQARESLRRELRVRGLGEGADARYRLETAHLTVARFRARLRQGERLAQELETARHRPFGTTEIHGVSLVRNDWYMTRGTLETVKRYPLRGIAAGEPSVHHRP